MLLASLAVCVCLILLAMCLISVEESETVEKPWNGNEALENLLWAQEIGLEDIARATGNYSWDRRLDLVDAYKNGADRLMDGISRDMLSHGIAFTHAFNDTLASQYAAGTGESTLAETGGILLKKSGNWVRVFGCAHDVSITDRSARYSVARVVTWG
jgi:hypothetical protein